jgi:DNA-binding PadR family transcriptional regulator
VRGTGTNHTSLLQLLDVNPQEKKMQVLRALLEACQNEGRVGFSDILKHLAGDDVEKPNESLIYRLLSSLEDEGFIEVDRRGYRHRYCSDLDRIERALQRKKESTLQTLSEERTKLKKRLEQLNSIGIGLLVDRVIKAMTDSKWDGRSRFGMGLRTVQLMADREVYAQAVRGDIVRITVDDVDLQAPQWINRIKVFGNLASRGVRVRVLFTWPCRHVKKAWRDTTEEYHSLKNEGLHVDFRIRTSDLTYQMVTRNVEVLVLTVAEEPFASICVPRRENPTLLDDVVDSFDTEFSSSYSLDEGDV